MPAVASPEPSPRAASRRERRAVALACLAAFAVFTFLASRHIDFPVYWHANTGGQVDEIIKGRHNFRQPLLLVTTAEAVVALHPGEEHKQEIAVLGRRVAIGFGGLAVVALILLAWRLRGAPGAFAAAAMLPVASPLVNWAHFFKEDTALVFGIAVSLLAMTAFWQERTRRSVVAMGAACGLAVAGKYVGILALPFALALLLAAATRPPLPARGRRLAWFAVAFVVCFVVANHPMLGDLGGFVDGIAYEIGHVGASFTGKGYVETPPDHVLRNIAGGLADNVAWPVQLLALLYLLASPFQVRRRSAAEWLVVLFGLVFAAAVSQSNIQSSRHYLPFWIWIHLLGVLGAADVATAVGARLTRPRAGATALAALLLVVLPFELHRTLERNAGFANASRLQLVRFVRTLPPDARIAAAWHAGLPDPLARHQDWPQEWLEQEIRTVTELADLGSVRDLVEEGFTHVVSMGRIPGALEAGEPVPAERARHERRIRFYRDLERCERVFDSRDTPAPRESFNGRWVQVYRLPDLADLGPEAPDPTRALPDRIARGDVAPVPRHVVLLLFDALRPDRLGSGGSARPTSPFLDALATRAVRFERATSAESTSLASAASLLTGLEVEEHRLRYRRPWADALPSRVTTLAELLAAAGWHTAAVLRGPPAAPEAGLDAGFARFVRGELEPGLEEVLASAPPGRPLFLVLEAGATGLPYEASPSFAALFPFESEPAKPGRVAHGRYEREHVPEAWAAFDAEVREADSEAERAFARLEAAGLGPDDAIFVVTALHGEEFREPHADDPGGAGNGRTLFQEQIHVPLFVLAPGRPPRVVEQRVRLLDVAPTVLELVGLPADVLPGLRGRSLVPALDGRPLADRPIFAGGVHERAAWIEGGWKYLRYTPRMRRAASSVESQRVAGHYFAEALFDLAADPGETRDLSAAEPERLERLREHLLRYERSLLRAPLAPPAAPPASAAADVR